MKRRRSKFSKWLAAQPRGTRARLIRDTSEAAVVRAQRGLPLGYEYGAMLAQMTGHEVTVEDLCSKRKQGVR
jgi:hypothetical protein